MDQCCFLNEDFFFFSIIKNEFNEQIILVKEKAYESYYECGLDGIIKNCTRTIEPIYEIVRVPFVVGYESITAIPSSTITKTKKVKVKDGYIATVPCDKILIKF